MPIRHCAFGYNEIGGHAYVAARAPDYLSAVNGDMRFYILDKMKPCQKTCLKGVGG